jgi:hypothetical protein
MSQYIKDIAIYGVALFAAGVAWEVVAAFIRKRKTPSLPLHGTSYDSKRA